MSDRLTQLQDCLDQLVTQMYACVRYIDTYHSPSSIAGQPDIPGSLTADSSAAADGQPSADSAPQSQITEGRPKPDPSELFQSRLHELASDLVLKEQQIEALISVLPGVGSSSAAQEARMRQLDKELRDVEVERVEAVKEKERLLGMLDEVIVGVRRP